MRQRSFIVVLVVATVIVVLAVVIREHGHGGMRKWMAAIHGGRH
jgi:hypothetical protein